MVCQDKMEYFVCLYYESYLFYITKGSQVSIQNNTMFVPRILHFVKTKNSEISLCMHIPRKIKGNTPI